MNIITDHFVPYVVFMGACFVMLYPLEKITAIAPMKKWGRSYRLDIEYSLISLSYFPACEFLIYTVLGFAVLPSAVGTAPVRGLPFMLQFLAVVFLYDCTVYIRHRFFHTPAAWPFHSVHHSSEEVNWISAERFHPIDNASRIFFEILLFLGLYHFCRFNPVVFAEAGIFIGVYNLFIHANCRWTFGPLRFVFASPVFHRWHHAVDPAAQNMNFASVFSFIDLALGTFYMPKDKLPLAVGLNRDEQAVYPGDIPRQILYPFRKRT